MTTKVEAIPTSEHELADRGAHEKMGFHEAGGGAPTNSRALVGGL